jgi:cytochrome P450
VAPVPETTHPPPAGFPVGASATIETLEGARPYDLLARLREREPVSWLPALGGWLVTQRAPALAVTRDARTFTVDDPRFTTAQVVGPSMLSLDGAEHARHRGRFTAPFALGEVRKRLASEVTLEAGRLLTDLVPRGRAELRREFAGPLASAVITRTLGLQPATTHAVLGWYDAIVAAVTDLSAGRPVGTEAREAVTALGEAVRSAPESSLLAMASSGDEGLTDDEVASNAAVVLFGGIETMEGMIANAIAHLLADRAAHELVAARRALLPGAVEESLRLEPAAAAIDRYARADVSVGGAQIRAGDLVRVSITAANRDPATFPNPDRYDPERPNAGRHLAFASGPHVCIGMHLARLETHVALAALMDGLPNLRLEREGPPAVHGLVFRKPREVRALWDA